MPNPVEIATLEVGGQIYTNWTSIEVKCSVDSGPPRQFTFIASEKTGEGILRLSDIKVKPGDKCTVKLAGETIIQDGWVITRQAAFDANQHKVIIQGYDIAGELIHADVPVKGNQFKKATFEQIAKKVMEPHGVKLQMSGGGNDAKKEFKDVSAIPGESVYAFIDRLARMRNLHLWSDGRGTLMAGHVESGLGSLGGDDLVEGKNILAASCVMDGQDWSDPEVVGQNRGDDKIDDEQARKPAAKIPESGAFVTVPGGGSGVSFGDSGAGGGTGSASITAIPGT